MKKMISWISSFILLIITIQSSLAAFQNPSYYIANYSADQDATKMASMESVYVVDHTNISLTNRTFYPTPATLKSYWRFRGGAYTTVNDLKDNNGVSTFYIGSSTSAKEICSYPNYYSSGAAIGCNGDGATSQNSYWSNDAEIYDFIGNSTFTFGLRVQPRNNGLPSNEWIMELFNGPSLRRSMKRNPLTQKISCCNDGSDCTTVVSTSSLNNGDNSTHIACTFLRVADIAYTVGVIINGTEEDTGLVTMAVASGGAVMNLTISSLNSGGGEYLNGSYSDAFLSSTDNNADQIKNLLNKPQVLFNASYFGKNISQDVSTSGVLWNFSLTCGGVIGIDCVYNITDANNGTTYSNVSQLTNITFAKYGNNISWITNIRLQNQRTMSASQFTANALSTAVPQITWSVSNISILNRYMTALNWNWTNPNNATWNYTSVYFGISGSGTAFSFIGNFTPETNNTFNRTALNPDTEYMVSTNTVSDDLLLNNSWVNATFRTLPLSPVTSLTLVQAYFKALNITWANPTYDEWNSTAIWINKSGTNTFFGNFTPSSNNTFNFTNQLFYKTSYNVQAYPILDTGFTSPNGTNVSMTTLEPALPTSLTLVLASTYWLNISWANPGYSEWNNTALYVNTSYIGNFTPFDNNTANLTGLSNCSLYNVQLYAYMDDGYSPSGSTNATMATLCPQGQLPAPPAENLTLITAYMDALYVGWDNPGNDSWNITNLYLNASFKGNFTPFSNNTFNITSLSPEKTYQVCLETLSDNFTVNTNQTCGNFNTLADPFNISAVNPTYPAYTAAENETTIFNVTATGGVINTVQWFLDGVFQALGTGWAHLWSLVDQGSHSVLASANNSAATERNLTWAITVSDTFPAPTSPTLNTPGSVFETVVPLYCKPNSQDLDNKYEIEFNVNGQGWNPAYANSSKPLFTFDISEFAYETNFSFRCKISNQAGTSNFTTIGTNITKTDINEFYVYYPNGDQNFFALTPYKLGLHAEIDNNQQIYIQNSFIDCNGDGMWDKVYNYTGFNLMNIDEQFTCINARGKIPATIGIVAQKININSTWRSIGCSLTDNNQLCLMAKNMEVSVQ